VFVGIILKRGIKCLGKFLEYVIGDSDSRQRGGGDVERQVQGEYNERVCGCTGKGKGKVGCVVERT
jgi:hypothetical protein